MSFLRDTGGAVLLQGTSAIIQFLVGVVLARGLQKEGRGLYALVILIPNLARAVVHMGYGTAATRQVAKDAETSRKVVANTLLVGTLLSVATCLALYLNLDYLEAYVLRKAEENAPTAGVAGAIVLGLFLLPLLLMEGYITGLLTGLRAILAANVLKVLQVGSNILLLTALFAFEEKTVYGAVASLVVSFLLSDVVGLILLFKVSRGRLGFDWPLLKSGIRFGLRVIPASVALYMLFKLDVFLMGLWRSSGEVGVYAVASGLAQMFNILGFAVERAVLPRIMRKQDADASQLTALASRSYVMIAVPAAIVAGLLAFPMVPLIYKQEFAEATIPFILFLPGLIIGSAGLVVNTDLLSRGYPHLASYSAIAALTVNVGVNWYVIPRWGMYGAASASLLCYLQHGMTLCYIYHRVSGVPFLQTFLPTPADFVSVKRMFQTGRG